MNWLMASFRNMVSRDGEASFKVLGRQEISPVKHRLELQCTANVMKTD